MLRNSLPTIITDKVPGPNACVLLKKRDNALPKALCGYTYPICIKRGEGAMLEDVDGNIFLDFIGGVGVLNIGYRQKNIFTAFSMWWHTVVTLNLLIGSTNLCHAKVIN